MNEEDKAALAREGLAEHEDMQTSQIGRHVLWLIGRGETLNRESLLAALAGTAEDPASEEVEKLTARAVIARINDIAPDSEPDS